MKKVRFHNIPIREEVHEELLRIKEQLESLSPVRVKLTYTDLIAHLIAAYRVSFEKEAKDDK